MAATFSKGGVDLGVWDLRQGSISWASAPVSETMAVSLTLEGLREGRQGPQGCAICLLLGISPVPGSSGKNLHCLHR